MHIQLGFQQKFYGIVYAQKDRNSACKIAGKGEETAKIDIPLKGCGTVQVGVLHCSLNFQFSNQFFFQQNTRVFKNDIVVRFHPGLEIEGDEVITVICRYPPPVVQQPPIAGPLALPEEPVLALQPLREFEILLIICAIIFLALLLLGIGCSYYCLKKRNIRVIRRRPASTIGSEVTRISDPPSMFAGLKIPRAHATDTSGSEEMTESVHTDYGTDVSSIPSVEEFQSAYSDLAGEVDENIVYPDLHEPPMPAFDTKMRIKKKAGTLTPISSRASSVTEEMLAAQEQYLTTILERTETNTMETLERVRKSKAELGPPPVHARLRVQHNMENMTSRESDSESQYSHDPLGTDLEFTEDERETATVSRAMVSSDRLQSARLVESVQTRQSELVTRREQEVRQRQAARQAQAGFDVTVRTTEGQHGQYSDEDTASMSEYTAQEPIEPVLIDRRGYSKSEMRSMQQQTMSQSESGSMRQQQSKFDVLIRVLDAPPPSAGAGTSDDLTSVFSEDDRQRWRDIVTHDSTFRTMLETAQTTEDVTSAVSQIRYISKYEKMFEPHKWDVLVRVLQTPGSISGKSMSSKSSKSYKTSKSGTEYDLR